MSNITTKIAILFAPISSFLFGIIVFVTIDSNLIHHVTQYFANAQILGAIPGIAYALYKISHNDIFSKKNFALEVPLILLTYIALTKIIGESYLFSLILFSAFISTYLDIIFKKYYSEILITTRFIQSISWIILISILLTITPGSIETVTILRSIGFASLLVGLLIAREHKNKIEFKKDIKKENNTIKITISNLIWMSSTNLIFLAPSILYKDFSDTSYTTASMLFLLQIFLQASGRISDYLTTQLRIGLTASLKEISAISFIATICILLLSGYKLGRQVFTLEYFVGTFSLSIAMTLWGLADSNYCNKIYSSSKNSHFGMLGGIASALLSLSTFLILKNLNHKINISIFAPPLIGSIIYYISSKLFLKK